MKQVRYVFHLAKFDIVNVLRRKRKLHLIDDVIALATWPLNFFTPWYSHMSVWISFANTETHSYFGDESPVIFQEVGRVGTCYTSTMRGDDNGTVSRPASEVFTHPERWEYIKFEVTDESFEAAKAWADDRVKNNIGYGKKTIFRFVLPLWLVIKTGLDDALREICSEHGEGWAARSRISKFGRYLLDEILIRSPRRLWRDLVRRHHVPTYSLATGLMVRDSKGKRKKL